MADPQTFEPSRPSYITMSDTMPSASPFLQFWWTDVTRDAFLSVAPREDLQSLRLVCHDFDERVAPHLFKDLSINFRSTTFTKPARMAALDRIGHHVRALSCTMAHGPETFLPPLIDATTGEEVEFIYEPYCQVNRNSADRHSLPKYGSWEMTDLLVKQYPPLFHAAANVPSFIRALTAQPNLRHLKISCPGQEPAYRYRRDVVDYALISLRIAVERSPLLRLDALSLLSVHPSAVHYLNPTMGLGALPNAARRWRQIRSLTIHMDAIPPTSGTDHLKLLHAYLQTFAATLTHLTFHWSGPTRGPFPLALSAEPGLEARSPSQACPRRCHLALRPLRFRQLVFMEVDNVTTNAIQVSTFILAHRRSIAEFNFEDTTLRDGGSWDDALAPLTRLSGSDRWKEQQRQGSAHGDGCSSRGDDDDREIMEVPLMLDRPAEPVEEPAQARLAVQLLSAPRCATPLLGGLGGFGGWHRASTRSRGFFEDQVRRLLRNSVLAWKF